MRTSVSKRNVSNSTKGTNKHTHSLIHSDKIHEGKASESESESERAVDSPVSFVIDFSIHTGRRGSSSSMGNLGGGTRSTTSSLSRFKVAETLAIGGRIPR